MSKAKYLTVIEKKLKLGTCKTTLPFPHSRGKVRLFASILVPF